MTTQATATSWVGRAVRIFMVFILVFGTSFHVEMALALQDYGKDRIAAHEGDTPKNLTVYQVIEGETEDDWQKVNDGDNIELQSGERLILGSMATWRKTTDEEGVATYVQWEVSDGTTSDSMLFNDIKNTLPDGAENQVLTVTCRLDATATEMAGGDDMAVSFTVTLVAPEPAPEPQISGLEVHGADGATIADGDTVEAGAADSAGFSAGVSWADDSAVGGAAADLVIWTVAGKEAAGDSCNVSKDDADDDGNVAVSCTFNAAGAGMAADGVGGISFTVHFDKGSTPGQEDTGVVDKLANHKDGEKLTGLGVVQVAGDQVNEDIIRDSTAVKDGETITVGSGKALYFAAIPSWDGKELSGKVVGDYTAWTVDGLSATATEGVVTVADTSEGKGAKVQVTCAVADSATGWASGSAGKVTFTVEFEKEKVPIDLEFTLSGKDLKAGDTELTLTREKGAQFADYQFTANIRAYDGNTRDNLFTYTSEKGASLAQVSGGRLSDLKWQLVDISTKEELDTKLAEIDPAKGLLKVHDNCEFMVLCTTTDESGEQTWPVELTVTCKTNGESSSSSSSSTGPDQGSPLYRQDSLRVTANVAADAVSENAAIVNPSSSSSSSSSSASSSSSSSATEDEDAVSSSSSSSSSEESKGVKLEKTYSASGLEGLSSAQTTYVMNSSAGGKITVTGVGPSLEALFADLGIQNMEAVHSVTFVDYAEYKTTVTWSDFAAGAPVVTTKSYVHDPSGNNRKSESSSSSSGSSAAEQEGSSSAAEQQESVSSSSSSSAQAADQASQGSSSGSAINTQAEGDDDAANGQDEVASSSSSSSSSAASSTASASADDDEFYDYTRFRVLFDGTALAAVDGNALRYIKEIQINPEEEVIPSGPENPEAPFTVAVAYAPAPLGFEAVFSPVASKEIAGATFDFVWEESSDKGKTWKTVGTNQTYSVKTTKANLGHLFRVTLNSDMVDEETGKTYSATSEPVEMVEASGFSVQLNYDPPIAGDIALFQANIIDTKHDVDLSKLDYIWEMSEDNGKTWTRLAKQYQGKPTLSIQTDPIDPSDESESDADVNLIYIRVRVVETTGQKRVRISNEQPLTVHVGDEKGTGDDKKNNAPPNSTPVKPVKDADDTQTNESSNRTNPDDTRPSNNSGNVNGNEDDEEMDDEDEEPVDSDDEDDEESDDEETAATPSNTGAAERTVADKPANNSELHINEDVTQQILQQQEAVQEYIESTVPGARWTALSASQASGDDARNVLSKNPFAPFAIPTGLGITVAGAVEKLLAFRRQIK